MLFRPTLLLSFIVTASPALGATLRPLTTLESPVVRVADLFDDAGAAAARVLGPAPAPGGRIVVEAAQLAAIARQFEVDWRPSSPSDRSVLDRPGRMLARDEVLSVLRAALAGMGAPEDSVIEMPGFTAPLVTPEARPLLAIEQLDYDSSLGRFTALLAITAEGMPMQRMRLSGTVQEMLELPVPVRRLNAGTVIQPDDLRMARINAGLARGEVARSPAQAVGMAVRHQIVPGRPLALSELSRPAAILKGARVTMQLQAAGLTLLAQGLAMEPGSIGDHIQVLNPASRAVVEAEVMAPDRVRVMPDSTPQLPAAGRAARLAAASLP